MFWQDDASGDVFGGNGCCLPWKRLYELIEPLYPKPGKAQESVATITTDIAPCPGADVLPRGLAADIVLRAVGVERDLRVVQHHQQLSLVGMMPHQQAVQGDEAGAAEEDAYVSGD